MPCFLHQIGPLKLVFLGTVIGKTHWWNWKNPHYIQVFPEVVSVFQIVFTLPYLLSFFQLSYYFFVLFQINLSVLIFLKWRWSGDACSVNCGYLSCLLLSVVITLDLQCYLLSLGIVFEWDNLGCILFW